MNFAIRAATARDIDDLLAMARRFAEQAQAVFSATGETLRAGLFGPTPKSHVLIAQDIAPAPTADRAACVGFALWHYDFDILSGHGGIYLSDLHLDSAWRGQGIALAFFRTLARRAVGENCDHLRWSSLVRNAPGVNLYQSLGAIPIAAATSRSLAGDALRALAA
jgi:GNAT superfamily N-acetyltransferase